MTDKILTSKKEGVLEITLNNPEKLNCMGFHMLRSLDRAVNESSSDSKIRVLVIKGAGDRAFSTGADLKEFQTLTEKQADEWISYGNEVFNRIDQLSIPTVAMINGYAIGGGLELALACDFRIGTKSAVLASTEVRHGWLPGWGGLTRLRRLIGEPRAKEVVLLGEKILAETAFEMGLLTRIIEHEKQKEELDHFTQILTDLDPLAFRLAKNALMDEGRTTSGTDVQFDILAMKQANTQGK
jgi:enoyl-CoA hydratase/carnithine racemase